MEVGSEIVSFVAPMSQVAAGGTAAYALSVDVKEELMISADVDVEVLRNGGQVDGLAEVEDGRVFLRGEGRSDPLGFP